MAAWSQLLISVPSDLASLALVTVLPKAEVSGSEGGSGAASRAVAHWQAATVRQLNALQPAAAASVAYAAMHAQTGSPAVHVVCHKTKAVAILKALAGAREQLQLRVSKESLSLRLSSPELHSAAHHALLQALLRAGWTQLSASLLIRGDILSAAEGQVCACESILLEAMPKPPSQILLTILPGTVRFRPLSVRSLLPEDMCLPSASTPAGDLVSLNAKLWSMQIPCTILPDCRPALLAGIRPNPGGVVEAALRSEWLLHIRWDLPRHMPHLLDVRFGADEDDPLLSVPPCCVLAANGLLNVATPPAAKPASVHPALRRLAGDITGSPFQLWPGGVPSVALVTGGSFSNTGATPAECSRWSSARVVACNTEQAACAQARTEQLTLLDLSMAAQQQGGGESPAGATSLTSGTGEAVKPSPALQEYLKGLARTREADKAALRPPLTAAASMRMQQPAAAAAHQAGTPAKAPVLSMRAAVTPAAGAQRHVRATAAEHGKTCGACAGVQPAVPGAGPAPQPAAKAACAKPVFAARKRPGAAAATQAAAKAPAVQKPKAAPAARKAAAKQQPMLVAGPETARAPPKVPASQQQPMVDAGVAEAQVAGGAGIATPAAAKKGPLRKRTKASDLDAAEVEAKVREKHAAGQLDKLSMPEMKCFLKACALPLGGKKADLVARLAEALAKEPAM